MIDKIKLQKLCDKITKEQLQEITKTYNIKTHIDTKAHYIIKRKYTYIDIGTSGRYMIENKTGNIFGIKAYSQVNYNHYYGNLDTIDDYYWGHFYATKK